MVSFWPWKSNDTSPDSFEKTLSALADKISQTQICLDSLRQRSRRLKALWTLYTSFAYMLCLIIMALVVGWQSWGATEYSALAGSPVGIYIIREAIARYFQYRIDGTANRLEELQTERTVTIDKLKAATKYNSTQQLLEKYGGSPAQARPKALRKPSLGPKKQQSTPSLRTHTGPPPPTANIPRNMPQSPPVPSIPQRIQQQQQSSFHQESPFNQQLLAPSPHNSPAPSNVQPGPAEFAPNAMVTRPQYSSDNETWQGGKWYDRILDVLLGEDETLPKNRLVLICKNCKQVNGQAPPGTKSLAELGQWRCMGCGIMNGEEDEGVKVMKQLNASEGETEGARPVSRGDDTGGKSNEEGEREEEEMAEIEGGWQRGHGRRMTVST